MNNPYTILITEDARVILLEEEAHSLHCSNSVSKRTLFLAQLCTLALLQIRLIFSGRVQLNVLLIQVHVETLQYTYVSVLRESLLGWFTRFIKSK